MNLLTHGLPTHPGEGPFPAQLGCEMVAGAKWTARAGMGYIRASFPNRIA